MKIKIIIDNDVVERYNEYYFSQHPKAKKKPIEKPMHPSINQWCILPRIQMNALKQKWKAIEKEEKVEENEQTSYSYDDLLKLSFKLILNPDYYEKQNGLWVDKSDDEEYMKQKIKLLL